MFVKGMIDSAQFLKKNLGMLTIYIYLKDNTKFYVHLYMTFSFEMMEKGRMCGHIFANKYDQQ